MTLCNFPELATLSWKLGFGNGSDPVKYIGPDDMCSQESTADGTVWKRNDGLTVKVTWQWIDGICQGHLAFSGAPCQVEEIVFPEIQVPLTPDTSLLVPFSQGRILRNLPDIAANSARLMEGRYRSFQFIAALDKGQGWYTDCRDNTFQNKQYRWQIDDGKLIFASVFFMPLAGQGEFSLPYRCAVATFQGDWFEAVQIYRPWARKQTWFQNASGQQNPLKNISMWVWNRGSASTVIPPVERLAADSGVPVALDWYWWHHNPYDTDYPGFWPPREGASKFSASLRRLAEKQIWTMVYLNGRTQDIDGDSCQEIPGQEEIERKRDGTDYAIAFNAYNQHRLGYMCGTAKRFQSFLENQVSLLFQAGLPGVYLDMIGCTTGSNCYHPGHPHPPGGGNYSITGYRAMLKRIRQAWPDRLLSTEDCAEQFLDLCDSMIVLFATSSERMGHDAEYVPAFSAIYHGANALFGSYALPDFIPPWDELWPAKDRWPADKEENWAERFPNQFALELAREIVWGMQPMVCNLKMQHSQEPQYKDAYQFLLDTARFYHEHRELLYAGEMMPPGCLHCDIIKVEFLVRGIFTRFQDYRTITRQLPAVLHGVWKSPGKDPVLILANYTNQPRSWHFEKHTGMLPERSYRAIQL
ncbi:MAG: hypothetical protein GX927_05080 [Lentisphaerae bacterium]|jgi:hypothetical protein|nr:hypothetical protein [Lentisphaerota bacterium]